MCKREDAESQSIYAMLSDEMMATVTTTVTVAVAEGEGSRKAVLHLLT